MTEQVDMFALDAAALAAIAARPPAPPKPEPTASTIDVHEDYAAREAAGTIAAVDATALSRASVHKGRTYGMTFYNYVVKKCPRCEATPEFVGCVRYTRSWGHQCEIAGRVETE